MARGRRWSIPSLSGCQNWILSGIVVAVHAEEPHQSATAGRLLLGFVVTDECDGIRPPATGLRLGPVDDL